MIAERVRHPADKRKPSGLAFACVLRELRGKHNLKQSVAAKRAGISRHRWARYERGLHTPLIPLLAEIAVAFSVDPGWLYRRFEQYRGQYQKRSVP